nr:restriction endonuclease subunit S [Naumannella cuiyingiana]
MAFVSAPETAEARRTAVQPGDVLLSITADLGRTAVVPDGLGRAFINQHLAILRAPSVAPRYLADFLSSPAGQREILGKDRGATKAGLNFDDVRSVTLPIPPLKLQTDYAERVDRINAQRATVLAAIEAGEGLFNSLQVRAFRGEL